MYKETPETLVPSVQIRIDFLLRIPSARLVAVPTDEKRGQPGD